MTPERFKQIEELYHAALGRKPGEWASYLEEACEGDEGLRREVESLLDNAEHSEGFLEGRALEAAARNHLSALVPNLAGTNLGRYEVIACLGRGGMGEVYRARDTRLKREVALKVLPAESVADSGRRRRFEQEARAASALNHPNIVTIHDVDQAEGIDFIAMEYVAGKTLTELIGDKGLPLDKALHYAVQIAGALAAAHAAGIVHRDIKPANIMVDATGQVKVLDFGLAKLTESAGDDGRATTQTDTGTVVGTVAYMSPEQSEGKKVDARSDIFSFGAVLYEMFTGRRAFQRDSTAATLAAILKEEPKPAREWIRGLPTEVDNLLARCLRKSPERRFQHIDDARVLLEELCEGLRSGGSGAPAGARTVARPDTVCFGVFEANLAGGELRKRGRKVPLQDQAFQVLTLLLRHRGETVTREELQRALWPADTFAEFEHGVNTAVNKLRQALGDSSDNPRFIERLPHKGYRFIAPVELGRPKPVDLVAPKEELTPEKKSVRPHARLWWGTGVLGPLIAALLVTGLWPVPAPRTRVTQLTHGGKLAGPFLAVHVGRILYSSWAGTPNQVAGGIWTEFRSISTEGGEPRRERMPFLNPDYFSWLRSAESGLGSILIYSQAAGTDRGEMWLAGFDGSKPRQIGEFLLSHEYSLSPDLKTLLRSDKQGLFARPVEGGPERLVARIDWKSPSYTFWHPSGERIGFMPLKDVPATIWEVKTDGTGMRPLLPEFPAKQYAANWSPDGERLYFISEREIYVRGSRHRLGWMRRPKPQRLTAGSVGYSIPFEDRADPGVIYATGWVEGGGLMKLDRKKDRFEPYLGGLSADCLDYSPDGQWIAYVSYPAGELWKCRRDGSDKVLLEDGLQTFVPRWSPDSKRLVFAAHGNGDWREPRRIYTIPAAGGKAELVKGVNGPGIDASWFPDGKKLLFGPWDRDGLAPKQDAHVSIVDLETGSVQMVPGSQEMMCPRLSPDGKHIVALTCEQLHPVIYDFETGRWAIVDAKIFAFPTWSKDSRYVYGNTGNLNVLGRITMATRKLEELRTINEFRVAGDLAGGISWTPDGEAVVLADRGTSEIYRIEVER